MSSTLAGSDSARTSLLKEQSKQGVTIQIKNNTAILRMCYTSKRLKNVCKKAVEISSGHGEIMFR
jgi:hypothetical protein